MKRTRSSSWEIGGRRRPQLAVLVAVLVLALAGCGHTKMAEEANDDEQLAARLDELSELYETRRVGEIRSFYAPEVYSVSTNNPIQFATGLVEFDSILTDVLSRVSDFEVSWLGPLRAWKDNDRVWTNRDFKVNGRTASGQEFVYAGRHSAIWVNRDGRWLIWYEHFRGAPELLAAVVPPPAPVEPEPAEPPPPPPAAAPTPPPVLADIFFDFDLWAIRPDQIATLEANLKIIQENPSLRVLIEGYCDMRGGDAYNVTLGQRRAEAALRWLLDHGVEGARLEIVSRGRVDVWAPGSGEPSWGFNRRAHFVLLP